MLKYSIFFTLLSTTVLSQSYALKISIEGKLPRTERKIYLENLGYGITDSNILYNNSSVSNFKIPKNSYSCYRLCYCNKFTEIFFVESDCNIVVNLVEPNESSTIESTIIDGKCNMIYQSFKNNLEDIVLKKFRSNTKLDEDNYGNLIFQSFTRLVSDYPFLGITAFYDFRETYRCFNPANENIRKYTSLIKSVNSSTKNHPLYDRVVKVLDSLNRLTPGGTIYDFTLLNTQKEYISTFDKRGKFLLILFSSRDCQYVDKLEKELIQSYNNLKALNFEILRVSVDFSLFKFDSSLLNNINGLYDYYPWESIYLFDNETGNKIMRTYNIFSWPRSFLYSPEGMLIESNPTVENIFYQLKVNKR